MSIWDEIEADDAARLEQTRREMAEEKAAWLALTPEQQAAEIARIEAKYPDVQDDDFDCEAELAGDPFDDEDDDLEDD